MSENDASVGGSLQSVGPRVVGQKFGLDLRLECCEICQKTMEPDDVSETAPMWARPACHHVPNWVLR